MLGRLFIFSAPSGAGKSSLLKALTASTDNVVTSISHTTRAMRPGEQEGVDYHFISTTVFEELLKSKTFLEQAKVFDNYYGTSRVWVEQQLDAGIDVILEIDWQGAQQVKNLIPEAIKVFILPPSKTALEERLTNRKQDSQEVINRRMLDATNEMSHYDEYDFVIINDDFDHALLEIKSVVLAQRCKLEKQQEKLTHLLTQLLLFTRA